jgi:hypothetical protein
METHEPGFWKKPKAVLLKAQPKSQLLWTPGDDDVATLEALPGWRIA